jgi:hypothetical protein
MTDCGAAHAIHPPGVRCPGSVIGGGAWRVGCLVMR